MTKGNPPTTPADNKVDTSKLVSPNSYMTSGFVDGNYLPATPSATTTLVEFGDYECPACGVYAPYVKQLLTDFSGKITYVFRNYPLPQHSNALAAAYAVEAAGLQGKYWQMHEKVYATQSDWVNLSDPKSVFVSDAQSLGLDTNKFTTDMNSSQIKDIVQADVSDGNTVGLTETPTFYLNNLKINLTGSYDQFKNLIQLVVPK
jgi:protein-disulfide isomerase